MENIQFRQRNSFNNVAQAFSQKRTEIPTGLNEKNGKFEKNKRFYAFQAWTFSAQKSWKVKWTSSFVAVATTWTHVTGFMKMKDHMVCSKLGIIIIIIIYNIDLLISTSATLAVRQILDKKKKLTQSELFGTRAFDPSLWEDFVIIEFLKMLSLLTH